MTESAWWLKQQLRERRLVRYDRTYLSIERKQAAREREWREEHAPAIAEAERIERADEEATRIHRLGYLVETGSHEERQRASNELDDARRARIARLLGDSEPASR